MAYDEICTVMIKSISTHTFTCSSDIANDAFNSMKTRHIYGDMYSRSVKSLNGLSHTH